MSASIGQALALLMLFLTVGNLLGLVVDKPFDVAGNENRICKETDFQLREVPLIDELGAENESLDRLNEIIREKPGTIVFELLNDLLLLDKLRDCLIKPFDFILLAIILALWTYTIVAIYDAVNPLN